MERCSKTSSSMTSLLLLLGFIHCFQHFLRDKLHKYPDKKRDDDNIICESEKQYKIWQSIHRHDDVPEYPEREEEFCCERRFWMSKGFPGVAEFLFDVFKSRKKVKKFHNRELLFALHRRELLEFEESFPVSRCGSHSEFSLKEHG